MASAHVEIRRLSATWEDALVRFFDSLVAAGDDRYFHPHPFTAQEAHRLASYSGQDWYAVVVEDGEILGYGMLRGWDAGEHDPGLGIVIAPFARGMGVGRLLMLYLHTVARRSGASRIRLKVYPENQAAIELYRNLGYEFVDQDQNQLIGYLSL